MISFTATLISGIDRILVRKQRVVSVIFIDHIPAKKIDLAGWVDLFLYRFPYLSDSRNQK